MGVFGQMRERIAHAEHRRGLLLEMRAKRQQVVGNGLHGETAGEPVELASAIRSSCRSRARARRRARAEWRACQTPRRDRRPARRRAAPGSARRARPCRRRAPLRRCPTSRHKPARAAGSSGRRRSSYAGGSARSPAAAGALRRARDAQLLHAMTQRRGLHPELERRAMISFDDPVRGIEHPQDVLALHVMQSGVFGVVEIDR